jgi:3-oxoacyl-[acyl-carrier-protein] synthase II
VSEQDSRPRVVITGIGLVTCLGMDVNSIWEKLLAGRSGIGTITHFDASEMPCQIAGEVPDFDPTEFMPFKEARRMSRCAQFALASAELAMKDANLEDGWQEPERAGVYFGTAIGGWDRAYEGLESLRLNGMARTNPFFLPSTLPNMPAFHVTQRYKALGPNSTITTACATGTQAIGEAAQAIRNGWADVIISGGTEALILDFILAGFSIMRALPTSFNDRPEEASRPFEAHREGFVFGEGAACLILESLEHAKKRGAQIYAEVAGFASSSDAFHIAAPEPNGAGAIRTMARALDNAGVNLEQVDYINAHGTSTAANDAMETTAIKALFKEAAYDIPISSTKSMMGHPMGASGAIEAAVCALTIKNGTIHPTINYVDPDPELDLDYVPNQAREHNVKIALSNSFGLGGQNACLVIKGME